jgi:hypothetical protein
VPVTGIVTIEIPAQCRHDLLRVNTDDELS